MKFGISKKSLEMLIQSLIHIKEIEKAAIFGSRALGNDKPGSDIDLVIYGSHVTDEVINHIRIQLNEELPLPYYFDLVHYESLTSASLKEHIDQYGKVIYEKK